MTTRLLIASLILGALLFTFGALAVVRVGKEVPHLTIEASERPGSVGIPGTALGGGGE